MIYYFQRGREEGLRLRKLATCVFDQWRQIYADMTLCHCLLLPISMGFFRLEISESNLLIQIVILKRLSIQIVFQNIENSRIRVYVKIELKFHENLSFLTMD